MIAARTMALKNPVRKDFMVWLEKLAFVIHWHASTEEAGPGSD
jgi:hypothetical protein